MTFEDCFAIVVGFEGGYVNNSADPGGETKYGISKRAYPGIDIPSLTMDHARLIYLSDYWGPAGCDAVPDSIKLELFDMAVNAGVQSAIKCLQRAVGETQDGILGPLTLQAVQSMPPLRLVARFSGIRLQKLTDLPTWGNFGKGWCRRIAANLQNA